MKTNYLLLLLFFAFAFSSCKKTTGDAPTVETFAPHFVASKNASIGCRVSSDGGQALLAAGIYIGFETNPEKQGGTKLEMGSDTGTYIGQVSGLTPGTKYYVKAFATNSIGESLGNEVNFVAPSLVQDNDANQCEVVLIEDQYWMASNLRSIRYRNGDQIQTTTGDISAESTPPYYWFANGDITASQTYGNLYTWYATTDSRNICPTGWHVPTDADWTHLEENLGGILIAGSFLKERGTSHWLAPYNTDASNMSCFTALPAGYRPASGTFALIYNEAHFWTATESEPAKAYERSLSATSFSVSRQAVAKNSGMSVRCVKD